MHSQLSYNANSRIILNFDQLLVKSQFNPVVQSSVYRLQNKTSILLLRIILLKHHLEHQIQWYEGHKRNLATCTVGMTGWSYWLTKYTNKETTIHNLATFHTTIYIIHVSNHDTLVNTMSIFTATCVGMVVWNVALLGTVVSLFGYCQPVAPSSHPYSTCSYISWCNFFCLFSRCDVCCQYICGWCVIVAGVQQLVHSALSVSPQKSAKVKSQLSSKQVQNAHSIEFSRHWWLFWMQHLSCYSTRLAKERKKERKKEEDMNNLEFLVCHYKRVTTHCYY